jgi:hypothetical protein
LVSLAHKIVQFYLPLVFQTVNIAVSIPATQQPAEKQANDGAAEQVRSD